MKVGDLVKIKHVPEAIGLVTWRDPNIHGSVTFKVKAAWAHLNMNEQSRYSFELEVINENR